jgi:hypothetical protein
MDELKEPNSIKKKKSRKITNNSIMKVHKSGL